jgi:hypothetical protein
MSVARAPGARGAPAPPRRGRSWGVTLLFTAASTYALDAFAIAVGALLAASGLLAGLDGPLLLAFLAATYAVWGAGLRVSLAANWSLLDSTGASSNVLSKAAHDLARARHAGPRMRRLAASSGYLVCELAKEVPYYASASGAVLLSDTVSAGDAIVFLGGTNLGAALYEYGLARGTRAYLRRRGAATEHAARRVRARAVRAADAPIGLREPRRATSGSASR